MSRIEFDIMALETTIALSCRMLGEMLNELCYGNLALATRCGAYASEELELWED